MAPTVMFVDDSAEDRFLAIRNLREEFPDLEPIDVGNPEGLAAALRGPPPDVVITDYLLQWTDGLSVLQQVRRTWPAVPVIMYTASGTEELAARATREGLTDYVVKTARHRVRLPGAVQAALRSQEQRRGLEAAAAEQRRLQQAIQSAAEEWRALFDAIPSPIVLVDGRSQVIRANWAAARAAGRRPQELIGCGLRDLAVEPWRTAATLVQLVHHRPEPPSVTVREEGSPRAWEVMAFPGARDGEAILIARDVTELVRLQESLLRSETMSALGSIIAGVAHEVRSPLFGISATVDAFEARFGAQPDFSLYFRNLRHEIGRLSALMQDLLELGRPAAGPHDNHRVGEVLTEAIAGTAPLAIERGVTLVNAVPPAVAAMTLHGDRRRLGQVFDNLIKNGLQHCRPGGDVVVHAQLAGVLGRPMMEIRVEDQGPGFRTEDFERLFEPFFSRRKGGTGLGLAIVRRIVDDHGGTVSAANRPEGGAVLRVALPVTAPGSEAG